jgi:hypothetical protein
MMCLLKMIIIQTKNIVLSKDLRTSVIENALAFHKLGNIITDNSSPNQVKLPFNTDLTNYNKISFCQSIIENADINCPWINLQTKITGGEQYFSPIK